MSNTVIQDTSSILICHTAKLAWGGKHRYIPNYRCWKPAPLPNDTSSFALHTGWKLQNHFTSLDGYFMLFVNAPIKNPPHNEITSPTYQHFWGDKNPCFSITLRRRCISASIQFQSLFLLSKGQWLPLPWEHSMAVHRKCSPEGSSLLILLVNKDIRCLQNVGSDIPLKVSLWSSSLCRPLGF